MFTELQKQVPGTLSSQYSDMGELVAIDGSLIDSVLSMHWAEYRTSSKKAKLHLGFDLNHDVPHKLFRQKGLEQKDLLSVKLSILARQARWIEDTKYITCLTNGSKIIVILFAA